MPLPFTKADVDYLIKAKKLISAIPQMAETASEFVMQADIRRKDDPGREKGLIIRAHAKKSPPGLPKGVPSCVIQWHGYRIRGVNRELWHDNPDGTIVRGWHEHIWNDQDRDSRVVPADVSQPSISKLFEWGLKRWNIEVKEEQLRVNKMADMTEMVVGKYLDAYKGLIVSEPVDNDSVTVSFPFHYSGHHRIELTITAVSGGQFIISDMARTVGELREFGLRIGATIRKRIEGISNISGLKIVKDHLLLESSADDLGRNVQRFLEAAKTIGDVYLVHRARAPMERDLVGEVRTILNKQQVIYKEKEKIRGQIETHAMHFLVPANGRAGLAIAVLPGHNSHLVAEAWGFKCDDMRAENTALNIGLIYDTAIESWTAESRNILEKKASIAVPGDSLAAFEKHLQD